MIAASRKPLLNRHDLLGLWPTFLLVHISYGQQASNGGVRRALEAPNTNLGACRNLHLCGRHRIRNVYTPTTQELSQAKSAAVCFEFVTSFCWCLAETFVRMVVRIMLMVPIYAIASLISLFSVEAAFVIDAIRDIYEVSEHWLRGMLSS